MAEGNDIDKLIKDFGNEPRFDQKLCEDADIAITKHEDHKPVVIKNAKIQYLKISIQSDENWKTKYSKLLESDNQQRLNEVVLKYDTVQKILQATRKSFLESENFDDFMVEVKNFLERTNDNVKKVPKFCALCMIRAFDKKTLSQDQIEQVLDLVDEKMEIAFDDLRNPLFALVAAGNIFDVLKDSAPEKFIQYVIDCIDFNKCKNGKENGYLFKIVCNLILNDPYSNGNFKQAIKNVLIDGKEYEEFRKKLSEVKNFGGYAEENLKQEQFGPIEQLRKKLSDENLDLCFKNEKFELKEIKHINASKTESKFDNTKTTVAYENNDSSKKLFLFLLCLACVILFIVAFVALFDICLSFFAVPKITSCAVFGICCAGISICVFFVCRINSFRRQKKLKDQLTLSTQTNKYKETAPVNKISLVMSNNLEQNMGNSGEEPNSIINKKVISTKK